MEKPSRLVELAWLNDGQPTKLGHVPVKGEMRLETKRAEGAAIVSADMNAWLCHLRACLCAAKHVLEKESVEEAHRQWNIMYGNQYENLSWDPDTFEASLDTALQDYVFIPLGVKTLEEAETILRKQAKEANAAARDFRKQRVEWLQDQHLEEVFWLLWSASPRPDFMPAVNRIPTEQDIAKAKDHISFFLDDVEYEKIIRAIRGAGALKANVETLTKIVTPEVVRGKVNATSKPSTAA